MNISSTPSSTEPQQTNLTKAIKDHNLGDPKIIHLLNTIEYTHLKSNITQPQSNPISFNLQPNNQEQASQAQRNFIKIEEAIVPFWNQMKKRDDPAKITTGGMGWGLMKWGF
ncbi:hypothetical protein Droror1_Dr00011864 [Drosera rotundifolia]